MLIEASHKHNLDLTKCGVIGDVGSTKILVLTGWGNSSYNKYRHTWYDVEPDYVADNLLGAVEWLLPNQ